MRAGKDYGPPGGWSTFWMIKRQMTASFVLSQTMKMIGKTSFFTGVKKYS
jgi:hypothetical protein